MLRTTIIFAVLVFSAQAESFWPQFRGPAGSSTAVGASLPAQIDGTSDLLWRSPVPAGMSSPVIVGDRIFLTGFSEGKLATFALKRGDGSLVWRRDVQPDKIEPFMEKLGSPAASTCATDGERVISFFGSHGLQAFDLEGNALWEVKLPLAQTKDGFGTGTSPIIHEGVVYLVRDEDGPANGLYAFDAKTGVQLWKQSRKEFRVSFGTPVVWDCALVILGDTRAKGYDLKTGEERWIVRGLSAYPCTSPTTGADGNLYIATWSPGGSADEPMPAFDGLLKMMDKDADNLISRAEMAPTPFKDFFDVNDKNKDGFWERAEWQGNIDWMKRGRNVVLGIKPGGKGDVTESHVLWSNDKGAPYVASPLYFDGKLFIVKDGGLATLYEAATGKLLYTKERLGVPGDYYVSPAISGNRIFLGATSGTLLILDASATEKPIVVGKIDLGEYLAASPAIVDGKLYVRTKEHLVAFGAR